MKISNATFLGVRGLPDVTIRFAEGTAETADAITVLTGPPACGKTRMIEALIAAKEVIAPYGQPVTGGAWIRSGERGAKIELGFQLDEEEQRVGGASADSHAEALFGPRSCGREADEGLVAVLERYEHDPKRGKVDYFPASRALPPLGAAQGTGAFEQRIWRLSREARKFGCVPRIIVELAQRPAKAERFAAAVAELSPTLQYVGATDGDPLTCFKSRGGEPCGLAELASSEVDAVVFAATALMVGHERSIVFVDKPESAVPERNMQAWLSGVRSLVGRSQLIIATNSAALLAAVPPGSVVELGAGS